MLGAILGDIVGSRFEFNNYKKKDFDLFTKYNYFTDDSVLTLAIAKTFNEINKNDPNFKDHLVKNVKEIGRMYPHSGYGLNFYIWLNSENPEPYNSLGNGSAMRVSPVAYVAEDLEECLNLAEQTAAITHNHPEGIRGAQAIAGAIFLAKHGKSKEEIIKFIKDNFYDYDFTNSFNIDRLRPSYEFDVTCQGSVPQALEAFFESSSFEDTIRTAISLGGDSDTIAAIAGSIAEAFYGIPKELSDKSESYLDETLLDILNDFETKYKKSQL